MFFIRFSFLKMAARTLVLLCCYVLLAVAEEQPELLKPCRISDLDCIKKTTQLFLEKTAKGIPEMGLKPIDPLLVDKYWYELPQFNISHRVTNLNITGLKNLQVTNFSMDTKNNHVVLSMNVSVATEGDIASLYRVQPVEKTVSGHYTANYKFLATADYGYRVANGTDGKEHYVIGTETVGYTPLGEVTYQLSKQFLDAIEADAQLRELRNNMLATRSKEFGNAVLGKMAYLVVPALVRNLRQAAAVLPMSAFFIADKN